MDKLFVLGDSISIDYGVYLEPMVEGSMIYDRKKDRDSINENQDLPEAMRGSNGGDSGMVLQYLSYLVANRLFDYTLLLLNCGLHDMKRNASTGELQVPLEQYETNLKAILELMQPLPVRMVWVRTTPVHDAIHEERMKKFNRFNRDVNLYNEVADRMMEAAGVQSIDLYSYTQRLGDGKTLFRDHVHHTSEICMRQAAYIAGCLHNQRNIR
ncbi:SGNH/GDSL hydrolase family protein [Paenibacillus qinlingensis]|uniref:Lysophospholipase L1-like esterase n=1 Tax=Paenibacillus qinlingensis TaxID=1837343 RepID=A0ABU1NTM4_9BACL|nr:SGNH/GDSL hydrolase family protein [Paenibacillus qinlingensis]MDR6550814.1 lysophospholipase L1-like esterase [Paenibacillus qinlingensis]